MPMIDKYTAIDAIQHRVCRGNGYEEHICKRGTCAYCGIMEIINDIENIEEIVNKSHWIDNAGMYTCAHCGGEAGVMTNYCADCGFRMDGDTP